MAGIEDVIMKMQEMGIFRFFLPFMLSLAIFYGLLRKSKIFGEPKENVAVNAIVSLIASFMVWAYPVIVGINIEKQLASFFTQGMLAFLVTLTGLLLISMFLPPDLSLKLKEIGFGKRVYGSLMVVFLLVGFGILISSGLFAVFFPTGVISIESDILITLGIILLMLITVVVIVFVGGK